MKVRNKEALEKFISNRPDSKNSIERFVSILENSDIKTPNQLKQLFPSADNVHNDRWCFNIRGNNFRIILLITFVLGVAYVRFVGTHAEYDRIDATKI